MKKKNNIQETMFNNSSSSNSKTTVNVQKKDLASVANDLKKLGKDVNVNVVDEELNVLEPEAVIAPQDNATIKYLSNVIDNKTGEISQPFTIGAQKYQMIRGLANDNQIVMAVFAHDETDDNGCNRIHTIEEFEQKIALPAKQKIEEEEAKAMEESKAMEEAKEDTYEGRKHFLVKRGTNEVRSFGSIKEMLSSGKSEEEDYMGVSEFKKHMNDKMFGSKKRKSESLNEITPTGEESDEEMNAKAKKLMDMIKSKLPNVIATIKTPVAQREVIAAFAELIGVPRNGLTDLVSGLKDLAKQPKSPEQPMNERVVLTKAMVEAYGKKRNVIKTIKIKDIK
jgi:hypothetical protein